MLKNKLQAFSDERLLVCLNQSETAKELWIAAGGDLREMIFAGELRVWTLTMQIPKENLVFWGSLEDMIALFPKERMEESKRALDQILSGVVLSYEKNGWAAFRCNIAVMGCCAGEYFSVVNRREI